MNISSINSTEHGRSPSMHRATSCAWFRPRRHPPATGCCLLISRRVAFVYDYCGLVRRCYYRLPTVAADSITGARKWLCSTENGREPIHDKDGRPAVIIQSFQKQTTIKFPPFFFFVTQTNRPHFGPTVPFYAASNIHLTYRFEFSTSKYVCYLFLSLWLIYLWNSSINV